jgi:hypothetical protein
MAQALLIILQILLVFSLVSLVAGFVRPVYVLWFLDRSNRLKVLSIYGVASVLLFLLIILLSLIILPEKLLWGNKTKKAGFSAGFYL